MKRLRLLILLILTIATVLIACRTNEPIQSTTNDQTASDLAQTTQLKAKAGAIALDPIDSSLAKLLAELPPVKVDRSAFPVTIKNCGRTLTFQHPPQRVISLWQPPNELLLALGVQDHIIGIAGNYTALLPSVVEAAKAIPQLGGATSWPSREVMLTQTPDLVVSEGLEGFAFDPAQGYATVDELEQNGAQVISTGSSCTPLQSANRGIDVVYEDLRMLGQVFGVAERAGVLIDRLQQWEMKIAQHVAGRKMIPTVFYNGGEGPLSVLTAGVWRDAIRKANGKTNFDSDVFQVGVEEFANSGAEVILIGVYPGQAPDPLMAFLTQTFPDLPAVRGDRMYPIPTIETEASIRIIAGLEKIARAIHPEAFAKN